MLCRNFKYRRIAEKEYGMRRGIEEAWETNSNPQQVLTFKDEEGEGSFGPYVIICIIIVLLIPPPSKVSHIPHFQAFIILIVCRLN